MAGLLYGVGLILVGGALALVLSCDPPWLPVGEVKAELVKTALQVLVFGLAGGGVKFLLDRQAEYRAFRTDMLDRLGRAHKDVYRIRRLLAVGSERTMELLGELMDARQDLGAAYHFARVWGLKPKLAKVQLEVEGMRAYLKQVIAGALAPEDAPERAVYQDFLDWQNTRGTYQSEFKRRYFTAKKAIDPSFHAST